MNNLLPAQTILRNLPGIISWRDKNCTYLGCNKNFARLFNLNDPQDIVGMTHFDILYNTTQCAQIYVEQDRQVLQGKSLCLLNILTFADEKPKTFVTKKASFVDENEHITGIICNSLQLNNEALQKFFTTLVNADKKYRDKCNHGSYIIGDKYGKQNLSPREAECLFYLLRGKTARHTAAILGISHKTVATHIDKIKVKFDCNSKSGIIELAIQKGYFFSIPSNLLKQNRLANLPSIMTPAI